MGHKSKKSLTRQVQEVLQSKLHAGDSKHLDKHSTTGTESKLYSFSTFRTYLNIGVKFTQFCKEQYGCKTLEQCKPYITDYIAHRETYCSAYTTKLDVSALNKLYGTDIRSSKSRSRTAVTRSRGAKEMDKHFSPTKNAELVSFLQSTGLRRAEATHARGCDLRPCSASPVGLGIYVRPSGAKAGRPRVAPLYCSPQTAQQIKDRCAASGDRRLFDHIHTKLDVHSLRAAYAVEVYTQNARDLSTLFRGEKYYCRNDMHGLVLDRNAMRITSNALGHNRIQVATHYLHGLQSQ